MPKPIILRLAFLPLLSSCIEHDGRGEHHLAAQETSLSIGCQALPSSTFNFTSSGLQKYRFAYNGLSDLPGISANEFAEAVFASAATWTDKANVGYFSYDGFYPGSNLPTHNCSYYGIDFNLIRTVDEGGDPGTLIPTCYENGVYNQWEIHIKAKDLQGLYRTWSIGAIGGPTSRDLEQTITHELGHALLLHHHDDGYYGVMTPTSEGTTRSRDLYKQDYICSSEISGYRALTGYRRGHTFRGFSSEYSFTSSHSVFRAFPGLSRYSGGLDAFSAAISIDGCHSWQYNWSTTDWRCLSSVDQRVGVGPRDARWSEDPSTDNVYYSGIEEYPYDFSPASDHRINRVHSIDGYYTQSASVPSYCNSYLGSQCQGYNHLYSGETVSSAWDDRNSKTVFAWVNQDRDDEFNNRKLLLSVGKGSFPGFIHKPTWTGFWSTNSPSVACDVNSTREYNCIVVFVSSTSRRKYVFVDRFKVVQGWGNPPHYVESAPGYIQIAGAITGKNAAAWYQQQTGKFYIAYTDPSSNIRTYSSSDGVNWNYDGLVGTSATGVTAVGYRTGFSNVIVYAR